MSILWPVPGVGATSSLFGEWPQWRRDMGLKRHSGLDIPAVAGQLVVAAFAGQADAGTDPAIGNWLRISAERRSLDDVVSDNRPDTPDRIAVVYMHLSAYVGVYPRIVQAGEAVGHVGSTGTASTGAHLHLSLWRHFRGEWWLMDPALELSAAPLGEAPLLHPATRERLY